MFWLEAIENDDLYEKIKNTLKGEKPFVEIEQVMDILMKDLEAVSPLSDLSIAEARDQIEARFSDLGYAFCFLSAFMSGIKGDEMHSFMKGEKMLCSFNPFLRSVFIKIPTEEGIVPPRALMEGVYQVLAEYVGSWKSEQQQKESDTLH